MNESFGNVWESGIFSFTVDSTNSDQFFFYVHVERSYRYLIPSLKNWKNLWRASLLSIVFFR